MAMGRRLSLVLGIALVAGLIGLWFVRRPHPPPARRDEADDSSSAAVRPGRAPRLPSLPMRAEPDEIGDAGMTGAPSPPDATGGAAAAQTADSGAAAPPGPEELVAVRGRLMMAGAPVVGIRVVGIGTQAPSPAISDATGRFEMKDARKGSHFSLWVPGNDEFSDLQTDINVPTDAPLHDLGELELSKRK